MEVNLSEEQAMMRDSVQRFVAEKYTLEGLRRVEADPLGWSRDHWKRFAESGWLALPLPEAAGGLGGTPEDLAVLMAEFGHGHVLEPYVSTVVVCGHILAASGNAQELLGQAIAGDAVLALAHAETARPRDLADFGATTAEPVPGGFLLSGIKRTVIDAPGADRLVVSAHIGADGPPSLFLVDPRNDAVSMSSYRLIDGSSAADIEFRGLAAAPADLIASGEDAMRLLTDAVALGTLAYLAQAVGSIERALKLSGDYAAVREQYGRPIGKFQALQHMLAAMFVEAQEARSALYYALAHWDEQPARRDRALSSARIVVGNAGRFISRSGIQLHGGYGMTEEFLIGHHFRRQIVLEKQFGDLEHHLAAFAA